MAERLITLCLGTLLGLAAAAAVPPDPAPPPPGFHPWRLPDHGPQSVYVSRVIDGDTAEVCLLTPVTVRLDGCDAPEMKTQAGVQSRDAFKELAEGKLVTAELKGREKYGRTLARLWLPGAVPEDVTKVLIGRGLAKPYGGGPRD